MDELPDQVSKDLPEGTVTFLFTDIEGSTRLLDRLHDKYVTLVSEHRGLLRATFAKWHGHEVDTEGDAFFVSFPKATEAIAAVVEAQRALAEHGWPDGVTVRVRMGLHTGEPWTAEEGYVGMDVHRAARIAHVGHGGQVLLSETTAALARGNLPADVQLLDLGQHRLKDMEFPEHIRQLAINGLQSEFPPLKSLRVVEPTESSNLEPPPQPAFLKEREVDSTPPLFVGRERELAWLYQRLDLALQNQGNIVFVTGEAGRGKSSLLQAFARQATGTVPECLITWGACNAFFGRGDAYLPFRQALALLSGDVEQSWRGGAITTDQVSRLWAAMPLMGKLLAEKGQAMVMTLVDGRALLARIGQTISPDISWVSRLDRLVRWAESKPADLSQDQLHQQCATVLRTLSATRPLLLLIDDLQWADGASLDLLFHLGRSLANSRLLIVGAFRPEEVALGRDGGRHPLEKVVAELRRLRGDVLLDLEKTTPNENRVFVDTLLDSEPNALGRPFRQELLAHTSGQPLFTVEILRYLQEQGDLVKDQGGSWMATADVRWGALPYRVEGVIEERIGRLSDELRDLLTIAAVEGENFTAQVLARIQEINERRLLRMLSRELDKRHHLVRERAALKIGRQLLSRYRFTHALFQQYLYNDLSLGERQILHGEIASVLEVLYDGNTHKIANQLARHFTESGEQTKALPYLQQAGNRAQAMYAHQEAIDYYQQAIKLFSCLEVNPQQQIEIFEQLGQVFMTIGRYDEAEESFETAVALAMDSWTLSRLYRFISATRSTRRDYEQAHLALDKADVALQRAPQIPPDAWWQEWLQNQFSRMNCYYWTNQIEDMVQLLEEMRPIVETYGSPKQNVDFYGSLAQLGMRQERGVFSDEVVNYAQSAYEAITNIDDLEMIAYCSFLLGFSYLWHGWHGDLDKAETHLQAALEKYRETGLVVMRTRCLNFLALVYRRRGDKDRVAELLPQVMAVAEEGNLQEYIATAEANMAWLKWLDSDLEATKAHGKKALAIWGSLPSVIPGQWTALWPLIEAAITQDELVEAVSYAERLMLPDMARLPDEVTAALQEAIAALANNQPEITRARLQTALRLARQLNQL